MRDYYIIILMYQFELNNIKLDNMKALAQKIAGSLSAGDVIALNGDLGAGKSTLARLIIQSLMGDVEVPSPTFTLVQTYNTPSLDIWHMDLYRLEAPEQIYELGVEEAFHTSACLIEWAENAKSELPANTMNINIANGSGADCRNITFIGDKWKDKGAF